MKTVLIVSHLQPDCSDNFVLPQQITFCNTNIIFHILKKINDEIKSKMSIDLISLNDEEINQLAFEHEITFLEVATINALLETFSNKLYDKSYFITNDENNIEFINITILQK